MTVTAYKTKPIVAGDNLETILATYLPHLEERSVVAISSKIVSICEGRIVKIASEEQKDALAKQEVAYYLPRETNKYNYMISITHGIMAGTGGIDESNGNGYYVLWPEDPQKSANQIRSYLAARHGLSQVGVLITDSISGILRLGVTGVGISHSGFQALNSYIGKKDLFGRKMRAERANILDSLATAAVAEMGEGDEQTPLAVITNASFVQFQKRNPTAKELAELRVEMADDVFAPLLLGVKWEKGKRVV
jgi:F420-0:gamma-glutamyl ligase